MILQWYRNENPFPTSLFVRVYTVAYLYIIYINLSYYCILLHIHI